MKDRILQFLSAEKISPAEFADKIGVQRSSMSHILNGRNYPSASFIQKMLHAYPAVNSRWLMIGEGSMNTGLGIDLIQTKVSVEGQLNTASTNVVTHNHPLSSGLNGEDAAIISPSDQFSALRSNDLPDPVSAPVGHEKGENAEPKPFVSRGDLPKSEQQPPSFPAVELQQELKEIEQILFFYKDKTFSSYRPS